MPTLNWIGKEAVINHHDEVPIHTLTHDPDRSFGVENQPLGTDGTFAYYHVGETFSEKREIPFSEMAQSVVGTHRVPLHGQI